MKLTQPLAPILSAFILLAFNLQPTYAATNTNNNKKRNKRQNKKRASTTTNNCTDTEVEFALFLTTDDAPEDVKWVVKQGVDPWRGAPVLARRDWGFYTTNATQSTYTETACLPLDGTFMFRILDESRNGGNIYSLSVNGVELFSSSGEYGRMETTAFQGNATGNVESVRTSTEPIDQDLQDFVENLISEGKEAPCMRGAAGETCDEDDECCSGTCMDNYKCRAGNGLDVNVYYDGAADLQSSSFVAQAFGGKVQNGVQGDSVGRQPAQPTLSSFQTQAFGGGSQQPGDIDHNERNPSQPGTLSTFQKPAFSF